MSEKSAQREKGLVGGGMVGARGENGLPRSWHDNVSVCDRLSGYELNLKQSWETAASCE